MFTVKARVWAVGRISGAVEVDLLVDTGATYTVLPASLLARLG
ncbi:hypothetical protein TUZN_1603 [Thermoproteus uzoniensis 768-20]|uniref:Peptidase A2 domain-containing protein n=1 Tax=Thermoproteus uzoniensis (strain 768-20) TaxID=999630 RepID=F2L2M2_THEU7